MKSIEQPSVVSPSYESIHYTHSALVSSDNNFRPICLYEMTSRRQFVPVKYICRYGRWFLPLLFIVVLFVYFIHVKINVCTCYDSKGKAHSFCYSRPDNESDVGLPFDFKFISYLEELELTGNVPSFVPSSSDDLIFVTSFSQSHFSEGKQMIASIRKHWKQVKIVVYDIGLSKRNAEKVRSFCNVEYRKFNFSKYPENVGVLQHFRWKPIAIAEALRDFGVIWYLDTSIVISKPHLDHIQALGLCEPTFSFTIPSPESRDFREMAIDYESPFDRILWNTNVQQCAKSKYLLHSFTGHGVYPATDPALYRYFPTNLDELQKEKAKMYEAGLVYAIKDEKTTEIMKWYVLCALQEDCMTTNIIPNVCNFDRDQLYSKHAGCHRYDQSVINVLLANQFYYDRHYYTSEITDFFVIRRYTLHPIKSSELSC